MKRKSIVKVPTSFGVIEATVKFDMTSGYCGILNTKDRLTRDEQQKVVDRVTDEVVNALRNAPYAGDVPLRAIQIS